MKILAEILTGYTKSVDPKHGLEVSVANFERWGEFPDLPTANAAMRIQWPDSWLSLSNDGFIVHDAEDRQVARLVVENEPGDSA